MKKKICVVTGSRAEYGLLRPLLKRIKKDDYFRLDILATGSHLAEKHGFSIKEIENDGFTIAAKVDIKLANDDETEICKTIGRGVAGFGETLFRSKPDMVVLLGDRFEIFASAVASHVLRIPVAHIHGGEVTEGAIDDAFRHSITKMSFLHFTAAEEYRRRVIQLGEAPDRVFNFGALGIDNIRECKLLEKEELQNQLEFRFKKQNILVTFHPETLNKGASANRFKELLDALESFPDIGIIFTMPNADPGNIPISKLIDSYVMKHKSKSVSFINMGSLNYLSAMKFVNAVVGNSSSGIIEAPYFGVPTVNIGDRQRGRIMAESIISCEAEAGEIKKALKKALSKKFSELCRSAENPYGEGGAADRIYEEIKKRITDSSNLKKRFYDTGLK